MPDIFSPKTADVLSQAMQRQAGFIKPLMASNKSTFCALGMVGKMNNTSLHEKKSFVAQRYDWTLPELAAGKVWPSSPHDTNLVWKALKGAFTPVWPIVHVFLHVFLRIFAKQNNLDFW